MPIRRLAHGLKISQHCGIKLKLKIRVLNFELILLTVLDSNYKDFGDIRFFFNVTRVRLVVTLAEECNRLYRNVGTLTIKSRPRNIAGERRSH